MITELYCDGGVIGSNPSAIGGTFAWRAVHDDKHSITESGVIGADDMGTNVTNNQTEMYALLRGLSRLPDDWVGTVYSDSQVTLGRAFQGWKWHNIPEWMHKLYREQRRRLVNWDQIKYVLLDGHPTRAQLAAGIGKRGHPVSEYNVWCDNACREAGERWLDIIGTNIPSTLELELAGA